ncbi:MAG: N-acetyltransferase [Nitrospirota bacterium]
MRTRKAKIADVKAIHKLVNEFGKKGEMLPRSLNDLYENIRDIVVCENKDDIIGVCALHIMWEDLAEVRTLAVRLDAQGTGLGKRLVKACIDEARKLGIKKVFALTYHPDFFKKAGFEEIDKTKLPQKIWGECLRCPKFPECDETAVIMDLTPSKKDNCLKSKTI